MPEISTFNTKRCTKCGFEKPLTAFSKDRNRKDGLQPHCKECVKAYDADYRAANCERNNAKARARHAANREHNNARKRAYIAANRETLNTKKKAYYRTLRGFVNRLWYHLNCRTINGKYKNRKSKSKQCRRYLAKGIELRITWDELYQFVLDHWAFIQAIWASGESVDLHRPESNGHYSLDNMEFLPRSVHSKLHARS